MQDGSDDVGDFSHLVGTHAEGGDRGCAQPEPACVPGAVRLVGHDVAVQSDTGGA